MPDLTRLISQFSSEQMPLGEFLSQSLAYITEQVHCERSGFWCIQGEPPNRVMRCVRLYDRNRGMLHISDQTEPLVSDYLAAFVEVGTIRAVDVRTHPATARLFDHAIAKSGVRSLMARAFSFNGQLVGAFSCAQLDRHVAWTELQLSILSKASFAISFVLARRVENLHVAICELPATGTSVEMFSARKTNGKD